MTCGSDGAYRIWDIRTQKNVLAGPGAQGQATTCDFNKYNDMILVSGGVDGIISICDLKQPKLAFSQLFGHTLPTSMARFSPWSADLLLSSSMYPSFLISGI